MSSGGALHLDGAHILIMFTAEKIFPVLDTCICLHGCVQDPHLKTDLRFMQFPANSDGPDSTGENNGLFAKYYLDL